MGTSTTYIMNLEKHFRRLKTRQNAGTIDQLKSYINDYDGYCHIFSHEFSLVQLKEFCDMGASVLVGKGTSLAASDITLLVEYGKEKVVILAAGFDRTELETYLQNGSSLAFASTDGFGSAYIEALTNDATRSRIQIITDNWPRPILEAYMDQGLAIYLTSLSGLTTEEIAKLIELPHAKELLTIPHQGYDKLLLFQFADIGATIRVLNSDGLTDADILRLIDFDEATIQVSYFDFSRADIVKYKDRGAKPVPI